MKTPRNELPASARHQLESRYARLKLRTQEPPPSPAREFRIGGVASGWITQAAYDALRGRCDTRLDADCLDLDTPAPLMRAGVGHPSRFAPPAVASNLDTTLAGIAERLYKADCFRGWRDELLDVITPNGVVGRIERAATRPLGLLTRAVHLNAWSLDGRIWIARRALSKSTDPGKWDTLVGGLVGAGESLNDALLRECHEEAGLTPADLANRSPLRTLLRMHRRLPKGYQVEDLLVSHCVLADGVTPANRDGEVSEIALVRPEVVVTMIDDGAFTLEAAIVLIEDMMRACDERAISAPGHAQAVSVEGVCGSEN